MLLVGFNIVPFKITGLTSLIHNCILILSSYSDIAHDGHWRPNVKDSLPLALGKEV